jgi:SSS family transporter
MGFTLLDYIVLFAYLIGIVLLGSSFGKTQKSTKDYFLGGQNIPWWAVCFAVVATETSALTFISIPGLAYVSNLNFLQISIGYILGRIAVSLLLLPAYFKGEISTAYTFLKNRFGDKTRSIASIVFMGTRTLADGVRLFATAIPLAILLKGYHQFDTFSSSEIYIISIIVMAILTLIYTYLGGVTAVIWTDVVQMFVYLGGAISAFIILSNKIPDGFAEIFSSEDLKNKLNIFYSGMDKNLTDFFKAPYTFWASIFGGAFLSMASHGTDQIIVQRLLTTNSLKKSQTALITSGFIIILQFGLFLIIGSMLYLFYNGAQMRSDEVFPKFIIEQMPSGVSGLIIAGLLAAAMSTLSGSISALASATVLDFYKPYFAKEKTEEHLLKFSRIISFFWCIILVFSAIFFMNTSKAVVELGLSIASFTYGGLLGTFLLGVMSKKISQQGAITGFISGITVMIFVIKFTPIAWTWYVVIGSIVTISVGFATSKIFLLKSKSNLDF